MIYSGKKFKQRINDRFFIYKSPVYTILFVLFACSVLPTSLQGQVWYNTSWLYRKLITIDAAKVPAGPHTNFPVLISITDASLQTRALANGNDILFTSANGTTKLNHQIENYTSGTGTLVAWVQVPTLLSSANTGIYVYYGNAAAANQQNITGTWDATFKGVWHMNTVFTDATTNANNGTNTGTIASTGKISGGRGYVRSDGVDKIQVTGLMGSPSSFTLSAWATLTTADPLAAEIISIGDYAVLRYDENGVNKTSGVAYNGSSSWTTTASRTSYAGTGWHYVAYTFDNVNHTQKVYVDGVQVASTTSASAPSYTGGGTNTFIGSHGNGNMNMDFDGVIDEARIANASRSVGWILTEYNNQNSPSTFYTVGNVEALKMFTGTGDFSNPVRWTGSTLPSAGDYLIINGTCTIDNNVGTDNVVYGPLVVGTAAGRTLNWAVGGTNRLNVSNVSAGAAASILDMTNGGVLVLRGAINSTNLTFTPGAGSLEFQSTTTLPAAYSTYNKLTINGTGITITLSVATTTLSENLTITSGTLNANGLALVIGGNWVNNGTFTPGTGSVTFNGGNVQTITQAGTGSFYNVTLNKSANGITLNNNITITNVFTLTAGKITLAANSITIGNTGSISGGSAASYVVTNSTGRLIQNNVGVSGRTGGIRFPLGTSSTSYTPITINNVGSADNFDVRVTDDVYREGTTGTLLTADVVRKTWMVSEAAAGSSNVTLTAQWSAADEGTGFSRTACGLSHYTNSAWDIPLFTTASGSNPYTISRAGITSFSPFAVEEATTPLPVKLLYFNCEPNNNQILLKWATASEQNNRGFFIERSVDGNAFKSIGFVNGNNNSNTKLTYAFVDDQPWHTVAYYKLKQVDWDEKFEYSPVVYVPGATLKPLTIYPNPVITTIDFKTHDELILPDTKLMVDILSHDGRLVIRYGGTHEETVATLNQMLTDLKSGIYFINIKMRGKEYSQKFVKE